MGGGGGWSISACADDCNQRQGPWETHNLSAPCGWAVPILVCLPTGDRFPFFYVFPKQNSFMLTLLSRGLNLESGSKGHAVIVWSHVGLDNQVLGLISEVPLFWLCTPPPNHPPVKQPLTSRHYRILSTRMKMKEKEVGFHSFFFLLGQQLTTLEGAELK